MAKMRGLKTNVRPGAMQFLLWSVVTFLAIDALSKFGLLDLTDVVNPVFIPIVASMFILLDVGIVQALKKGNRGKLDAMDWSSIGLALLVLTGVLLTFFGINIAFLEMAQGFAGLILGIVVIINIYKK